MLVSGVLAASLLAGFAQAADTGIRVGSYKGTTLEVGERSGLIIGPDQEAAQTVTSSDPEVVSVEKVLGFWVAVTHTQGTATITAAGRAGETASITLTVGNPEASPPKETGISDSVPVTPPDGAGIDLNANMEIRQEMIRLVNEVRRENSMPELVIDEALMNAAQDCSAQKFTAHHTEYECKTAMRYGYPYGFGDNLTVFTPISAASIAKGAVSNWVHSPGHFQAMIDEHCDCIGVGVTVVDGRAYCYMFAGDPGSHHPYE